MKLIFDTVEELRDFVKTHLKNPRGGKGGAAEDNDGPEGMTPKGGNPNPPPLAQPPGQQAQFQPQGGQPQPAFNPQSAFNPQGAQPQPAFNPQGGAALPAAVADLVQRIGVRIDGCLQSGQPLDQVLGWFRDQSSKYGVDATNANVDQIKTIVLPRIPQNGLEAIAKLMAA